MAGRASVTGKQTTELNPNSLHSGVVSMDSKPFSGRTATPGLILDHQFTTNHVKQEINSTSNEIGSKLNDNQSLNSRIGNNHTNNTGPTVTLGGVSMMSARSASPNFNNFVSPGIVGHNSSNSNNIPNVNMAAHAQLARTQLNIDGRSSPIVQIKQEGGATFTSNSVSLHPTNNTSIVNTLASSGNPKMVTVNVTSASAITTSGPMNSQIIMANASSNHGPVRTSSPQILSQPIRLSGPQMMAPRGPLVRLPHGSALPPGFVLINKGGNIQAVQINTLQPHLASNPAGMTSNIAIRPVQGGATIQRQLIPQPVSSVISTIALTSAPMLTNAKPMTSVVSAASSAKTSTAMTVNNRAAISAANKRAMDDVNKCKNFLNTLIRLASNGNQPPATVQNVKDLVKNLIDGVIQPDEFTRKLQKELKSSPQPYLVPFLKKNLPPLRQLIQRGGISPIQGITPNILAGVTPGNTVTSGTSSIASALSAPKGVIAGQIKAESKRSKNDKSAVSLAGQMTPEQLQKFHDGGAKHSQLGQGPTNNSSKSEGSHSSTEKKKSHKSHKSKHSSSSPRKDKSKEKEKDSSAFVSRVEEDDINDVTSMAGVNLSEESARMASNAEHIGTQLRSCEQEAFLSSNYLQQRINKKCSEYQLRDCSREVVDLVSSAVEERLKSMVEKLSVTAQHRLEIYRDDPKYETVSDVRSQLKFFEALDSMERKRRDEQEREMLLRAAKSRSKQEDPEQLRLKRKAKEMQQMEAEQIRQQEANLTALAAIGPRKRKKIDSPPSSSSQDGVSSLIGAGGSSSSQYRSQLRRIKRVNIRDLIFLMEQETETRKSNLLYKCFFK